MPYPDSAIESIDPRFQRYIIGNAGLERLYSGLRWAEGPVWFGDGRYLLFSDIPNNRILRWHEESAEVHIFRQPSQFANGHTRDRQGRLISCEHATRSVTRTEYDGTIHTLINKYQSKRLNAPNDVVVKADDSIWFSDPGYGILSDYEGGRADFELTTAVYRLDPKTGIADPVIDALERPNGLCFAPDESLLYVADSGESKNILVYDVIDSIHAANGRVFVEMKPAIADGMRIDEQGNLWVCVGWGDEDSNGVHCFAPDGTLLGRIHIPEPASNLCFGGLRKNRLFITAGRSLYSLFVNTRGVQYP